MAAAVPITATELTVGVGAGGLEGVAGAGKDGLPVHPARRSSGTITRAYRSMAASK
jgi:hypothetical protein